MWSSNLALSFIVVLLVDEIRHTGGLGGGMTIVMPVSKSGWKRPPPPSILECHYRMILLPGGTFKYYFGWDFPGLLCKPVPAECAIYMRVPGMSY